MKARGVLQILAPCRPSRRVRRWLAAGLCTCGTVRLGAQVPAPPPTAPRGAPAATVAPAGEAVTDTTLERFRLRAGRGRIVLERGERITYLEGGVHLESDSTTIESRRARVVRDREHATFYDNVVVHDRDVVMEGDEGEFWRPLDTAEIRGRVRIRDPRGVILAQRARYRRDTGVLRLWGNVDFQDPKTRVQSDSALYFQRDGHGEAFGNVILTDRDTGTEARGPRAVYDRTTGEARMVSRPHMVVREKDAEDTHIEADDLQMDRTRTQLQARGDVRIRRGDTTARGDSAFLDRDRSIVRLRGSPELRQRNSRMLGREIDVYYTAREVQRVEVRHEAQLIQSRADTSLIPDPNVVRGDSARLFFEDGELDRAIVVGSASSVYVPTESRPNRISINEAEADSIVMMFEKDEVQEVLFDGTAAGTYRYYEGNLDSLRAPRTVQIDTVFGVVRGDTTAFDFRQQAERVEYMAERILYLAKQNDLLLQNAAQVDYQSRTLRAGRIRYDADTDLLEATERPVLDESGDRMYGETMGYDMTTKKAWVEGATTTFDQGYYEGRDLRKEPDGTLQVQRGSYTTCDLAHPHYRFESDRMKIYLKDKVVGSPVRIYVGDVPVGWLPFIVNSANTERHSGFLQPYFELGIASNSRFIRGLDYYWAASPYFDFLFSGDYTDRERPNRSSVGAFLASARDTRGFGLSVFNRYKVRYHFEGNVEYRFVRQYLDDSRFWTLRGNHDQRIGERATLRGNIDYASSDRANKEAYDQRDYERSLVRQLTSALSLNRPGDLMSFSANLRRVQRVDPEPDFVGELNSFLLPNLTVTFRSIRLGPAPRDPARPGWAGFLHDLQLTPGFNFSRTTTERRERRTDIPPGGVAFADSFRSFDTELITASTGANLSRRFDVLFLNLVPAVGYFENYVKSSERPDDKHHFRRFTTGLGVSTTFYGTFYPRLFGLNALRHVLDVSTPINYAPEITGQQERAANVNLNLRQKFDVKLQRGDEERRVDGLVVWSLTSNYNPYAVAPDSQQVRKFSNITSSLTINQSGPLTVQISQVYDPYAGRILSTRVPFGLRLGGRFGYGDTGQETVERNRVVEEEGEGSGLVDPDSSDVEGRPRFEDTPDPLAGIEPVRASADGSLAWDLGLSYSLDRQLGRTLSSRVGVYLQVQPTRNWSVRYNASYDGTLKTLANPAVHVTRDLHCWKASFSRIRDVDEWRYYFRIWVTKHEQDLFLENGERGLGY